MQKLKKDHAVGGAVTLLGIAAMLLSMQIALKNASNDPGSRVFPMIAGAGLIVCGLGIFITAGKREQKVFLGKEGWLRVLLASAVMILYTLGLKYLGFLISTPLFLFAIISLFAQGKKSSLVGRIIYSLVVTGCVWYVFGKLLAVALPAGVLF